MEKEICNCWRLLSLQISQLKKRIRQFFYIFLYFFIIFIIFIIIFIIIFNSILLLFLFLFFIYFFIYLFFIVLNRCSNYGSKFKRIHIESFKKYQYQSKMLFVVSQRPLRCKQAFSNLFATNQRNLFWRMGNYFKVFYQHYFYQR